MPKIKEIGNIDIMIVRVLLEKTLSSKKSSQKEDK